MRTVGRGGQKFIEQCVSKVAQLRERFPEKDIEVDGGVGPSTVDVCAEAGDVPYLRASMVNVTNHNDMFGCGISLGSNVIVAGTAIFGAENPEAVIAGLKESVEKSFTARGGL